MSRAAFGQVYREPDPATAITGRGVQMVSNVSQTLPSDATQVIVEFDALGDEPSYSTPQYDDFGLRSVGAEGDVPAGSAVVIDAAHAGRWLVSLTAEVSGDDFAAGVATVGRQMWVYVNFDNDFIDDAYDQMAAGDGLHIFEDGQIGFPPIMYDLAEGDVVWVAGSVNCPSLTSDGGMVDVVLTMVWCG